MKKIISGAALIFCALCFTTIATNAHAADAGAFVSFANRQDSLFMSAYNQHDTKKYNALLDEFIAHYTSLDSANQLFYKGYLVNAYYNLSCIYGIIDDKDSALTYLQKAIKAGYNNYAHLKEDGDLVLLHNDEAFKAILQSLRATGDYMYIIKRASAYNTTDNRPLPAFTYQPQDNPNLVALRKEFNLDSIAGTGNEVSKILNLMHWLHNLVPHDGNHENPTVKNAMSMIAVCKKENRGLNCRGLATVLNECYLSLGFKSRFVTCLPKDSLGVDNDCHVINMVYAPSLKKWLWIDPTFNSYVMNEKGELLGLEEVRQRIINDEPLIISPDANWNHKESETKDYYLNYYMAKNLYRLECPASSEYDTETGAPGKQINYIDLLPLDYFKQPTKSDWTNPSSKTTQIFYYTNNPAYFWQAPQ